MRIIPVLDLMGGQVVRGRAGRREEYRPLVSQLTPSTSPLDVALAFRDQLGLKELYLADLDAIGGAAPASAVYAALKSEGFRLLVDAGIHEAGDARPLLAAGVEGIVAGLETLAGPVVLKELCREHGGGRVFFSLDLKEGRPLGSTAAWTAAATWPIAEQAVACGVSGILVLDLARVGTNEGIGTEDLCRRLAETYSDLEVLAGGGVRGREDLQRLQNLGVNGALVASALHQGRVGREHLGEWM